MVAEKHRKESISDNWKELGRISLIVLSELSLCVLARLLLKKNPGMSCTSFQLGKPERFMESTWNFRCVALKKRLDE